MNSNSIQLARTHHSDYLNELKAFLKLPSISTDPAYKANVRETAVWLADQLHKAGLENVELIETANHPLIYADWLQAGEDKPTVLIYGHYDVQPVDPLDLWDTPPFEPTVKNDFIYARGASDDKGQLYIHVKAVAALLQSNGRLPVNVKFLIEGEEESGGESLAAFIPQNKEKLKADIALVSDTGFVSAEQPSIVYGLRGLCYLFLDIIGPARDLHSGSFGGGINNPLNVLGHVIARLKDEYGRIQIPGFYDDIRPLSQHERDILAKFPLNEADWLAETGAPEAWGEPEFSLIERLGARPTLDVHGIIGGYTGDGAKTVLPSKVHAKISMRLVPDQNPADIAEKFEAYVSTLIPPSVTATVTVESVSPASMTDLNEPAMKAAEVAYERAFGKTAVYMREGGSIPVVGDFSAHLGIETILMGFGLPGDNLHAPNERFYLPNFFRGIETSIHFLEQLGDA